MSESPKSLGRSMLVVSGGILLSRVLGLVRDVTFANEWGTGTAFAAFVIAFTIPNLLRALFGEGAFAASFVPVFTERLEKEGQEEAWHTAQRVLSVLLVVLAVLVAAVSGASLAARPYARGELARLTLELLAWLMPYGVLICLTAALAAVLNSLKRFALSALTPMVLNVVLIAATLFVCPWLGERPEDRVRGLALAVLVAGCLQLGAVALGCRRCGLKPRFVPDWRAPEVRRVALLMGPVLLGAGVAQFNVAVDRFLAGWLGSAATGSLYFSQRLVYLPVGLFGVAMGVVCLPAMSRAWARNDPDDMRASLRYALRHVLFLTLPTAALLGLLGRPVIRLIFERGTFTADSTAETLWALAFYLPGIPAFACAKIAVTPFYARQDTTTPVKIAAYCLALNVVLNLILMSFLRQGGLALATSICSYVNVAALLSCTHKRLGSLGFGALLRSLARIAAATLVALVAAAAVSRLAAGIAFGPPLAQRALEVALPLAAGGAAYTAAAFLFGCAELRELTRSLLRERPKHPAQG